MFNNYLKLSFILELQKKYNKDFSMFTKEIFVLPPIFKKGKLKYFLCFPVVKMLSNFNVNLPLSISSPIGVICINKQGEEKVLNILNSDLNIGKNLSFDKKYTYHIENQETIKTSLDSLSAGLKTSSLRLKKEQFDSYIQNLKTLLDKDYWQFYEALKKAEFVKKNSDEKVATLIKKNDDEELKNYRQSIKKEFSLFVKTEILPYVHNNTSFYKIKFFDELGKLIRNINFTFNFEKDLKLMKNEAVKLIAKLLNKMKNNSLQIDFLSKVLVMIINAMLVEQKKKKVIQKFEDDLYNYFSIFKDESKVIPKNEEEDHNFLLGIYNDLTKDYNKKPGEKYSNIFFAYLYIFN